jgi:hypothetical protein
MVLEDSVKQAKDLLVEVLHENEDINYLDYMICIEKAYVELERAMFILDSNKKMINGGE